MRDNGLKGKIAFVTGAAGGIGAAVVRLLLDEGARVLATDSDDQALARVFPQNRDDLRRATLDVTDSAAVDALIETVETEWGPIELGVNVAGILATGLVVETD